MTCVRPTHGVRGRRADRGQRLADAGEVDLLRVEEDADGGVGGDDIDQPGEPGGPDGGREADGGGLVRQVGQDGLVAEGLRMGSDRGTRYDHRTPFVLSVPSALKWPSPRGVIPLMDPDHLGYLLDRYLPALVLVRAAVVPCAGGRGPGGVHQAGPPDGAADAPGRLAVPGGPQPGHQRVPVRAAAAEPRGQGGRPGRPVVHARPRTRPGSTPRPRPTPWRRSRWTSGK